jgi:hypothetical protein
MKWSSLNEGMENAPNIEWAYKHYGNNNKTITTKIIRESPFTASGIQTGGLVESRECLEREGRQGIYQTTTNRGTSRERIRGASAEGN